ncbi:tetratricopeptide repeat protein [Duganella sp. HH105]|uniref:tetratricopeptide repeat protein n=1 Tax=Duganella sp. HH105 TaxID=1781067 RepID=UPI000877C377|nr:tetratricopeptide repeat protein [Duganella sp. HH105]OEZ52854.1 beta-barrel assembly-enhancing protease [Duganella sp. HH105]
MNDLMQQLERSEGYLASDPDNNELLARVIDLSLAAGDGERAVRHAQAALARYPDDAFFLARLGSAHLLRREWAEAAAVLAPLLARHPDLNLAYNLAYACLWLGRHANAYAAMTPYLDAAELSPPMVTLLVRALHHMGEGERAIALADAHMAHCEQDAAFLAAASLVCFDAGRLEQAEQLSAAALALGAAAQHGRPQAQLEALVTAGSLALARVDGDAAVARFQQVLALNPDEGRSWSGLGTASLLKRDLPNAQQQLEQAVRYMPAHIGSWHLLGWSRLLAGQLDSARAAFQTALDLDRNFGDSHGGLAVVQAMQGQRELAEAGIERALGLDKESLSARYAQMVLAGETADPQRFSKLAMRLLSSRQGAFGQNLGEIVKQHGAK